MTTGSYAVDPGMAEACADTVRIRVLPREALGEPAQDDSCGRGFDPYSTDVGAASERQRPRRTLDDMRRLSEAIVRKRLSMK